MKNSKKIMMTMALGLSLGALGFGVNANLDTNTAYAEENQVDLWFRLLRKVGDNKNYGIGYSATYVYINGVPQVLHGAKGTGPLKCNRGERVTFKLKETDEPGAPFVAEGEFDVPLKGYKDGDGIEIKMRELDQSSSKTENKKSEVSKQAIADLKEAKHKAEVTRSSCQFLIRTAPDTIKPVRAILDELMAKQVKLIKQAEAMLAKYDK